jgi:hypothetical protein
MSCRFATRETTTRGRARATRFASNLRRLPRRVLTAAEYQRASSSTCPMITRRGTPSPGTSHTSAYPSHTSPRPIASSCLVVSCSVPASLTRSAHILNALTILTSMSPQSGTTWTSTLCRPSTATMPAFWAPCNSPGTLWRHRELPKHTRTIKPLQGALNWHTTGALCRLPSLADKRCLLSTPTPSSSPAALNYQPHMRPHGEASRQIRVLASTGSAE